MNLYSIAYTENNQRKEKKFTAASLADCKERFIRWAFDKWDFVESEDYKELIKELKSNNIFIKNIEEIDE